MEPQVAWGELGVFEADPTERGEQHIGHRGAPQPELVGPHGGGRGAVGEQIELAFLNAVLHFAARAVELLIEVSGAGLLGFERSDTILRSSTEMNRLS
jgi:hypothetical protein